MLVDRFVNGGSSIRSGSKNLKRIGWREWVCLPEFGIDAIKAKIDTGARSSAMHAAHITPFERDGEAWVHFEIHPFQRDAKNTVAAEARVLDQRSVRSSTGHAQLRWAVETLVEFDGERWPIELTLTSRAPMGFRLLLGRQAVRRRFVVDPARSYFGGKSRTVSQAVQHQEKK
jgi:hypothetical protein